MPPRFYSKEWVEQVQKKSNSDEAYLKKAKTYTTKMVFVVRDDPDGNDIKIIWDFQAGKLLKFDYSTAKAPSNFRTEPWNESISLARIQATYATYVKLQKRELSPMAAMSAKLYMIEGNMIKIMVHMGNFTAAADLWATVPCVY
jgi:putative sterol carrier protein